MLLKKKGEAEGTAKVVDGLLAKVDLAKHVNTLAEMAYDMIATVEMTFFTEMQREVIEIGEEVLLDPKYSEESRREHEENINNLRQFCPENDPDDILQVEAEAEGRRPFIEAMCLRVRHCAEIGKLSFELRHARDKSDLIEMINAATEGVGREKKVFSAVQNKANALVRVFGLGYNLNKDVFGRYHDFAKIKLAEAAHTRAREIAENQEKEKEQKKNEMVADDTVVTNEELFFCEESEVNEKTTVLSWTHGPHENAIKLRRIGGRLYFLGVIGKMLEEDLKELRRDLESEEPYILLSHILTEDGENLCKEESDGRYLFGKGKEFICGFKMTRWVRNAAGRSMPHRLLPENQKKKEEESATASNGKDVDGRRTETKEAPANGTPRRRPVKPPSELMTSREFYYWGMVGCYAMKIAPGFRHNHEEGGVVVSTYIAKQESTVQLSRRQKDDGTIMISVTTVDDEELAQILGMEGVEVKWEYQDGKIIPLCGEFEDSKQWPKLPLVLKKALGAEFRRLKESEAEKEKQEVSAADESRAQEERLKPVTDVATLSDPEEQDLTKVLFEGKVGAVAVYHERFLWGKPKRRPGFVALAIERKEEGGKLFLSAITSSHQFSPELIGEEIPLELDQSATDHRKAVKLVQLDKIEGSLYQTYKMVEASLQVRFDQERETASVAPVAVSTNNGDSSE